MASPIDVIPTKKLEDLLECSICLGILKDPRTLPCSHSFCKLCLERFVQGQRDLNAPRVVNTFNCPVCRCKFTLNPEEGVDGIAINYLIRNMLDLMAVEGRVSGIPCSHHFEQPSVARCVTCEIFLCQKCCDDHNNYAGFRTHNVLSMSELSKPENRSMIRGKPRCKEHDDEILKYFCETCKELICRDCRDYNHDNHKCLLLKNAAEKMTEELKMRSATLTQEVEEYSVAINAMNTVAQSLEENMEAAKRRISGRKQEILAVVGKMLDKREKSLVDEIEKIYHEKHKAIQQQLRATQTQANNLHQSLDVCKRLLDNEDPVEIVSSHSFICNVQSGKAKNQRPVNHGGIPFYQCSIDDLQDNIKELLTGLGNTKGETSSSSDCPICLSTVTNPKRLPKCGHIFCTECIDTAFTFQKKCPVCEEIYGITEGDQPNGTMTVQYSSIDPPGYNGYGSFVITYTIPSGTQDSRHPKPGKKFHGATRYAYLPATEEGEEVLKLLQKAFENKLVFTIGRSTTAGRDDCVTWNDIHHKTSMYGGPERFGYPDPDYLRIVKHELKAKGIVPE